MVKAPSSPPHPASLVDPSAHSPALLELLDIELSRNLIEYLVDTVVDTVDYALGRPSSSSRGRSLARHTEHAKFTAFVTDVLEKAEATVPAVLTAVVYIQRAKPHIQIALEQWACERVFLGGLIVANKYLNDSTLKNVHWALCTGVFGKRDIGRIEREFLDVLDFELSVSEADLLAHHAPLVPHRHAHHHHHHHHRRSSSVRRRDASRSRFSDSDASDEMDVDSESSFESLSPPQTPAQAHLAPLPYSKEAHALPSPAHQPHPQLHPSMSSALHILQSFPLPHFSLPRMRTPSKATPAPPLQPACRPHHTLLPSATTQVLA